MTLTFLHPNKVLNSLPMSDTKHSAHISGFYTIRCGVITAILAFAIPIFHYGCSGPTKPKEEKVSIISDSSTVVPDCYLNAGPLTMLYAEPTMFSERIAQLPTGRRYKILEREIYEHISKHTFYKIQDEVGNVGWVQHDPDLGITPECR